MAKNRTLNEIRQSKEYQRALDIQTEKVKDNRTHPCSDSTAKAIAEHQLQYKNPFEHAIVDQTVKNSVIPEVSDIDVIKNKIVESLNHQMYDIIFESVNEEMHKFYVFQEDNYLTEAGMDMFEEEWFEFYHDHHGDILWRVMQNLK